MKPVLIDTAAAAVELGVSVRTVHRLVKDGLLTDYGPAGDILVSLAAVKRLGAVVGDSRQPRRTLRRLSRGLRLP